MQRIDFAGREGRRRAAFVILYARDAPIRVGGRGEPTGAPVCLMLNRSDGQIGFVGGMVEPEEDLESAVRREALEEIGAELPDALHPLVAHDIGPITTHAYCAELRHDQLRAILVAAPGAAHFGEEITGVFLPHLVDHGAAGRTCAGLGNLLRGPLAPSVREELVCLILERGLLSEGALADVCERAGFELMSLRPGLG